ncbi:MAG: hypothetical protein V4598_12365 [Bdellovibrionota bacterium]
MKKSGMIFALAVIVGCNTSKDVSTGEKATIPGEIDVTKPYPVYPGCESPAGQYNRTIVLDGNAGQTLQAELDAKRILPGDHIILTGPQGSVSASRYSQPGLVNSSQWIWLDSQGATFTKFDLRDISRIFISRAKITSPTGNLFALAGAQQIVLADSELYGTQDSSSWDPAAWMAAPNGINSDNATCVSFVRNNLLNLRFGMSIFTRGQTSDVTSLKALALNNELRNLSGDFIRPNGSDITIQGNKAYDGYLNAADGDANHDDFIQGFAYPLGIRYSNVQILHNYFLQTTDSSRLYQSDYQGISVFDGNFTDYLIRGNTVLAGAYHGIAMYWGEDGVIENNTVLSIYPGNARKLWISAPKSKQGDLSKRIVIRNNITNQIVANADNTGVSYSTNAVILPGDAGNHFESMDVINSDYDLRLLMNSVWYGMNVGAPQE